MIDIVTLTYNSSHCLPRFLEGLDNGNYPYRLTVIDGCSSDSEQEKTLSLLKSTKKEFAWIPLPENYFHTRAINNIPAYHESVNVGLKLVSGPHILLINPDCFGDKEPGWLKTAMEIYIENEPDIGVLGAILFHHDDTIDHAGGEILPNGVPNHIGRFMPDQGQFDHVLRVVDWNTGAWQLTSKSVLEKVGYHRCDGKYGSDFLLCVDAKKAGLVNACAPIKLYHNEHESSNADFYENNVKNKKRSY